jgi:amino acid adenylation domain-containing protein
MHLPFGHYENLLEAVTRDPDGSIWRLPFLSKAEEAQLEAWNQTEAPAPQGCIHQMFSEQARSQPEALAILFGDQQLTYGELDRRSNQLARYLRTLGVGAESLVALCCERSIEMVVGILGTLKAGGAYLPLDPNYPAERLSFMLADSGAQILLTQATLADRLPDFTGKRVCLDRDWALIAEQPSDQPDEAARPDNLAYMIYTSGSTGKPKGTLLEHRGLCNLAAAQKAAFAVDASARVLQFSSLSFDASVWETFMALVNGAALVLAEADRLASPPALQRLLQEQRVTHATLPPSVLLVLPAEDLPDLRVLVAAGEACPEELVARWGRGRCFFNAYGPTETTVCATLYACAPEQSGPPPIGRPLPNFRVHVVDERLQPVPVGVPGELLIGGAGLARGYHNRPDLTAEKFIPDPFSKIPNARLYRSGDLARYRPDGNVEFLGRIDHQVKLRGFRIELGEIEANLLRHPGVRQTAVVVAGIPERLVAFLVPTEENSPETDELRAFLRASLPEYMLPNAYLSIEALPLSPSGKVDRRSLAGQVETHNPRYRAQGRQ